MPTKPNEARNWLLSHVAYTGNDCLKWPFSGNWNGRGHLGWNGKIVKAHRLMCILAHGEPPTPKHQAAHNCGNGHLGCVNPNHLEWKTNSENQRDRRRHGTHHGGKGSRAAIPLQAIDEIRRLKGIETQLSLAKRLGVSRGCIEYWQRSDHAPAPPSKLRRA